jgi:hypothetical protein
MGGRTNGALANTLGWCAFAVIAAAGVALVWTLVG